MQTKDVILMLRNQKGLSQEELAKEIFVTRQAVSRWEKGETLPSVDTLKLLSRFFDVSINTLLGSPRELVCRCCGMPLDDEHLSRENDGHFNEDYCKWCYSEGEYTLDFWREYGGNPTREEFLAFKEELISDFNLILPSMGLPKIRDLNVLSGEFINMEYTLPNGQKAKFLDDKATYLGSQLEGDGGICYGIAASSELLLVCSYEENGENPKLLLYRKR